MRTSFVGPLPTRGPWTAVGLGRGQFFAILALSIACFAVAGGPIWRQPHGGHLGRILLSYAIIVPAVALALRREHPFPVARVVVASALIALMKLLATTLLLATIALATR